MDKLDPTAFPKREERTAALNSQFEKLFTSLRTEGDRRYGHMAERMNELAAQQPGFLGLESARTADGLGITVSYWSSEEAIAAWKAHVDHKIAQETGQRVWYSDYHLRVARVERDYGKQAG